MLNKKLQDFLDSQHVNYSVINHLSTSTAQRTAAAAHIPGKEMAKTVMVKTDDKMAMAVLPANNNINLAQLKEVTGAENVSIVSEGEFRNLFPDCEVGAMPPFGNLYGMNVYVEESLSANEPIAFNGGSHRELVQMPYKAFEQLVHPTVSKFCR
ncbi:aminoacyl-tRNA deacylase [Solitalea koreensis]|uniref:Ala-tRNA(Pro) deacylase n=1 Tax=Solitalea koreensis TaxID=543615 RepID=A0A521C709_9SPHI|nr:YbaK/EbsC family protein [Solitalea koreensis]SMO54480.1 Ala-tRNA(Pro) deacylase [Solitalea koreensis]